MFKVVLKLFSGEYQIVDGYFNTKREAEEFLIANEGKFADYTIVSRRRFESEMGIRRPFQLQFIKKPKHYDSFKPPLGMRRRKK